MDKKYLSIIGILLLVFLLLQINIEKSLGIILSANKAWFAAAIVLTALIIPVKAFKWKLIAKSQEKKIQFGKAVKVFLTGFFFSVLTPARAGDFLRAHYIKEKDYSFGKALAGVVLDRLMDLVMLFALAIIALFYFSQAFKTTLVSWVLIAIVALVLAAGVFIIAKRRIAAKILKPFFRFLVPERHKSRAKEYFDEFYKGFSLTRKNKKLFAASIIVGLLWIALHLLFAYFVALAVGINIDASYIIMVVPIITLVDVLPISIAGLGTREAASVFLFGLKGVSAEASIAFSLCFLALGYFLPAVIGGILWSLNAKNKPDDFSLKA